MVTVYPSRKAALVDREKGETIIYSTLYNGFLIERHTYCNGCGFCHPENWEHCNEVN